MQNTLIKFAIYIIIFLFAQTLFSKIDTYKENYALGRKAYAVKNYKKAFNYLRKAHKEKSENGNPLFYIALILEIGKRKRASITIFEKAIKCSNIRFDFKRHAYYKIILYYRYRDVENEKAILKTHLTDFIEMLEIQRERKTGYRPSIREIRKLKQKLKKVKSTKGFLSDLFG